MRVVGVDGKGKPVETTSRLHGARFEAGGANIQQLFASDGDVNLTVDAQGLPHGAGVAWSDTMFPLAPPSGKVVGARSVTVEGEVALAQPLILSLRFEPTAVKAGTARLYRMEDGAWKEIAAVSSTRPAGGSPLTNVRISTLSRSMSVTYRTRSRWTGDTVSSHTVCQMPVVRV